MKTKNNIQKAILKSMAVVVSFVLISITVNAQDFWKSMIENSGLNEIALAMVESEIEVRPVSVNTDAFITFLEVGTEEELKLEDWMTNETSFNANAINLEVEAEEAMELEEWMIEDSNFGISSFQIIEETESELELEDWMLDKELFDINEEQEPTLEIEEWMISEKTWIG